MPMSKLIGLTYDLKSDWQIREGDPVDINAEFDSLETIERIEKALCKGGHTVMRIGSAWRLLSMIDHLKADIIFNICEGRGPRSRESQVPMLLEMKGIPFVGADALSQAITLDKIMAKKLFIADGIPTPRFFEAQSGDDLEKINSIGFPLIVKTRHEGTSKGISAKSRVEDTSSLKRQVALINHTYKQTALVEEFIRGMEFTVPVLGNRHPEAMPIVQMNMGGKENPGDEFYTFEKVVAHSVQYICPAKISKKLTEELQYWAVKAYQSVECRDFGRVDFRVDEKGNLYVLEINPLPNLGEGESFDLFPKVLGLTYDEVINQILNFALERYGLMETPLKRRIKTPETTKKINKEQVSEASVV